jgi:hypothetical protein
MNDLENHIISRDILKTCQTVAQYGCKKKVKTLITFLITQYSDHYMNDNVMFIHFMVDRILSIQECSHSISKRIVRVSLCELFVALLQLPRKPKIKMIKTLKKTIESNNIDIPPFHMSFRNKMISSMTYLSGLKQLCNLDDTHQSLIHSLLYYCKQDYKPNMITEKLSLLYRYKAIINLQKLKQQSELSEFKDNFQDIFPDNFYSVLVFLCLSISDRFQCWYVLYLFMLKPHFNLLLLAFNIASTPHFEKVYSTKNTFYLPVILQCAMKVDYLYNEMCQTDFTTLTLEQEAIDKYPMNYSKTTTKNRIGDEEDTTDSEDFDVLFTLPEKKPFKPVEPMIDFTQNQVKVIILKNQTQSKDKNMYNISKKI